MFEISLIATGATLGAFVVYFILVANEQRLGRRVILVRFRNYLDSTLRTLRSKLLGVQDAPLQWTVRMQAGLDRARNQTISRPVDQPLSFAVKSRTPHKTVVNPNSHLAKLQQNRVDTALTPRQIKSLRKKHLEERF